MVGWPRECDCPNECGDGDDSVLGPGNVKLAEHDLVTRKDTCTEDKFQHVNQILNNAMFLNNLTSTRDYEHHPPLTPAAAQFQATRIGHATCVRQSMSAGTTSHVSCQFQLQCNYNVRLTYHPPPTYSHTATSHRMMNGDYREIRNSFPATQAIRFFLFGTLTAGTAGGAATKWME